MQLKNRSIQLTPINNTHRHTNKTILNSASFNIFSSQKMKTSDSPILGSLRAGKLKYFPNSPAPPGFSSVLKMLLKGFSVAAATKQTFQKPNPKTKKKQKTKSRLIHKKKRE